MLTKLGISTAPGAMKAPRRTIAPGTARKAGGGEFLSRPSRRTWTAPCPTSARRPGPPEIASIGFSRNDSSTAFLSHWWTIHAPPCFSAIRASPLSSAAIAASTAWRTSPLVSRPDRIALVPGLLDHGLQRARSLLVPQDRSSQSPTSVTR